VLVPTGPRVEADTGALIACSGHSHVSEDGDTVNPQAERIGVVGAGVIGLSTAVLAQGRGRGVTLYTDSPPMETTSAKAAASFKPHEVVLNELAHSMLVRAWSYFDQLANDPGTQCGVRLHTHWEASSARLPDKPYLSVVKNVEALEWPKVPGGYAFGLRYTTFFVDMAVYLPWLAAEFARNGGEIVFLPRRFQALDELGRLPHQVIINCTGLGARLLCSDTNVYPIKGQVAIVGAQPDMDWSISADGFYVYPRSTDTVIGGTTEHHVDTETTDRTALSLLVRANRRILPHLSDASILRSAAGLRPFRDQTIRVEAETVGDRRIVHNYGHGGAGITLSWGSAELALDVALT
jgi:D-amino-acid oxidase